MKNNNRKYGNVAAIFGKANKKQEILEKMQMNAIRKNISGFLICLLIAYPAHILGRYFPLIGGAVIALLSGMVIALFWRDKGKMDQGIKFTAKKVLQWAVILLGFGLNLNVILKTGGQSLPILICTITVALLIAWLLHKIMRIPGTISILVGVGSAICGGSAIAATAPAIDADDEEVAQAISVIFFFNILAALAFPTLGKLIGFDRTSGEAFGFFAGTAVNDTSSVTAAASAWDSMWGLGTETLDKAVMVKLTRTLAILPITLALVLMRARKESGAGENTVRFSKTFPFFILYFVLASVITTAASSFGVPSDIFNPLRELSKFLIVLAMAAIGLNTDLVKLMRTGVKPLFMGACCWVGIVAVSLAMQKFLGIW